MYQSERYSEYTLKYFSIIDMQYISEYILNIYILTILMIEDALACKGLPISLTTPSPNLL